MRKLCSIAVILLPLAVAAVHAGIDSRSRVDSLRHLNRTLPTKGGETNQYALQRSLQSGYGPIIASKDGYSQDEDMKERESGLGKALDLRYVDWDTMHAANKGKNGNAEQGTQGEENGNGDPDDENGQKNGEDGQDEGGGGWDRVWDAPKLG